MEQNFANWLKKIESSLEWYEYVDFLQKLHRDGRINDSEYNDLCDRKQAIVMDDIHQSIEECLKAFDDMGI
jgi:hypothetical protein